MVLSHNNKKMRHSAQRQLMLMPNVIMLTVVTLSVVIKSIILSLVILTRYAKCLRAKYITRPWWQKLAAGSYY